MGTSLDERFAVLCAEAAGCRLCPGLADKLAVLSGLNGTLTPKVMFIAEAPGRQGADRTRRPFDGDKSGRNFDMLLTSVGLTRDEIFVTNSVMCSPRSATDANRRPTRTEILTCSSFLRRQIELIQPPVIATLGAVALEALNAIAYHQYKLATHAGQRVEWDGRVMMPLYHPSPQVIASQRGMDLQLEHFRGLGRLLGLRIG